MLGLSLLFLFAMSMVTATPSDQMTIPGLLDIVQSPESAAALKVMLDDSPGYSYIDLDLSDVSLLKVSVMHGDDDSVISRMEMPTNSKAAAFQKAIDEEAASQSQLEPLEPESID
ncbi:unnamed protein product [Aureobasidium vineae]|uniref:Uncharacterized protein n=1 Tax=Aureobasidium vineae TaxID=2773715 RepID=A0A9N8K1J3_9PEZI|nr:unnamed protein product [Aureobasidium vineae]